MYTNEKEPAQLKRLFFSNGSVSYLLLQYKPENISKHLFQKLRKKNFFSSKGAKFNIAKITVER